MNLTHHVYFSAETDTFTNSRTALANLLFKEGHKISDLKLDLVMEGFQNLVHFPDFIISVSHTKGAGAAVLGKKSDYHSVGIDIEWSDRQLKPESQKFFRHPQDFATEDLLELWTMKEAAFKALSPAGFPGVLVLSKIIIQNGEFWTLEKSELKGKVSTFKIPFENRELCVSIALTQH